MNDKLLLTVEDSFVITGRGVVVLPGIAPKSFPEPCRVRLLLPDGSTREAEVTFGLPFGLPDMKPQVLCLIKDLIRDDVPVGTEIIELPTK